MQFSNVLALAAVAAANSFVNTTSTATVSDISTTVVTITSCEEHACTEVPVTTGVTVVTTTIGTVVTEYTTYCPLPTEVPSTSTKGNATVPEIPDSPGAAAKAVPAVAAIAAGVALLF